MVPLCAPSQQPASSGVVTRATGRVGTPRYVSSQTSYVSALVDRIDERDQEHLTVAETFNHTLETVGRHGTAKRGYVLACVVRVMPFCVRRRRNHRAAVLTVSRCLSFLMHLALTATHAMAHFACTVCNGLAA